MQEILSKKDIGERIRDLRIENGFSQSFLADILNLSRSNYSQIELGNQYPTFATLHILARYYTKSYEWLLHGYQTRENSHKPLSQKKASIETSFKQPLFTSDADGKHIISWVSTDLQTEYLNKLQSQEFIKQLPVLNLPANLVAQQAYRAFSVNHKNLPASINIGDTIVGKFVNDYSQLTLNNLYIIVKDNEILTTRILSVSIPKQALICRSNPDHTDFITSFSDILELWEATGKFSTRLEPVLNDLEENLKQFESTLKKLENELLVVRALKSNVK